MHRLIGTVVSERSLWVEGPLVFAGDRAVAGALREHAVDVQVLLRLLGSLVGPLPGDKVVCSGAASRAEVHGDGRKLGGATSLHEENTVVVRHMTAERAGAGGGGGSGSGKGGMKERG